MKLYYSPGSCGLASQIALREADQAFDLIKVDFKTKQTVEGDYYQVTPKGFVPALKLDDGDILTEGAVILQWIADHNPQAGLMPVFGSRERYTALEWLNFVANRLDLKKDIQFNTRIASAHYDEAQNSWNITTSQGEHIQAQFLIACCGMLSAPV